MKSRQIIHDSRQPIRNRSELDIERSIGTFVTQYYHRGRQKIVIDIETESPLLNSTVYGRLIDPDDGDVQVRQELLTVAEKCRTLSGELSEHAHRLENLACQENVLGELTEEIDVEQTQEFTMNQAATVLYDPTQSNSISRYLHIPKQESRTSAYPDHGAKRGRKPYQVDASALNEVLMSDDHEVEQDEKGTEIGEDKDTEDGTETEVEP